MVVVLTDSTLTDSTRLADDPTGPAPGAQPDGTKRTAASWHFGRFALLRALGISLVFAFLSLWDQGLAIIGTDGLTPVVETFEKLTAQNGSAAPWKSPSLFWLCSADWFILSVAAMGGLAAVALTVGLLPRWMCLVCFVALHSFGTSDGCEALWFYWPFDLLVTEVTILCVFLAPAGIWPMPRSEPAVPRFPRYLLYWVVFRLLFGPGITKVYGAQPEWLDMTVMRHFLVTLPHPTAEAAWMLEQPMWVVDGMTAFTLAMELVIIWGVFIPGWPRLICAISGIALMVGIQVAGSFRGFNILTTGLFLLMVKDSVWLRCMPWRGWAKRWRSRREAIALEAGRAVRTVTARVWCGVGVLGACVLFLATAYPVLKQSVPASEAYLPKSLASLSHHANHFRLAGIYSMFAIIPLHRQVIVWQGSQDGETWKDYQTLGIPARLDYRPRRYAPYHDYLGFLMWVSGFGPAELSKRWAEPLQEKLLAHEPETLSLFVDDPFEDGGPRFVRASRYLYRFADAAQRAQGVWWERQLIGPFVPARERMP